MSYPARSQESFESRLARAAIEARSRIIYTDEELLGLIRQCARELGRTPGVKSFNKWCAANGRGASRSPAIVDRFGRWSMACELAGLTPNRRASSPLFGARRFSHQDYVDAYQRIRQLAGRSPTLAVCQTSRPSTLVVSVMAGRTSCKKWRLNCESRN